MEPVTYTTELLERRQLAQNTFEAVFTRPAGFTFVAGQRIRLHYGSLARDYSLVNRPGDDRLILCIRQVTGGRFSPLLAAADVGTRFRFSGPHGYFLYRPSERPAVFVATGTGVAPFASMALSGVEGFTLLHGVRRKDERYYAPLLQSKAARYVACLTGDPVPAAADAFKGRVTDFLASQLANGRYDFYLCGRQEMIRDVSWLIDDRFPGSLAYTEIFF